MNTFLILLSSLLWWVLYSSIGALFVAIIAWAVLRWIERCPPVFNRTYLACLLWMLLDVIVGGSVLMKHGAQADPLAQLHTFGWRAAIVLNMSSTRNGTTSVRPTAASSPLVKPVTRLPRTSGSPLRRVWRNTAGPWHTAPTGLPAA